MIFLHEFVAVPYISALAVPSDVPFVRSDVLRWILPLVRIVQAEETRGNETSRVVQSCQGRLSSHAREKFSPGRENPPLPAIHSE